MIKYPPAADWRSPHAYSDLLLCDRRVFAWEWLRRSPAYRDLWRDPGRTAHVVPRHIGLLAWVDPSLPASDARPIWSIDTDPHVLRGRPADAAGAADDLVDIRSLSTLVSVEVDAAHVEHWLLSNGHWAVRLDLHDGTLLGGPTLVEHRMTGLASAAPKIEALRQFILLARKGRLPASLLPRERRAAQWILELRAGDALLEGAPQQAMADRKRLLSPEGAKARSRRAPLSCRPAQRAVVRLTALSDGRAHGAASYGAPLHPTATWRSAAACPPVTGCRPLIAGTLYTQIGFGSVKAKTGYAMEPDRFLRMQSVLDRTGLSRATLYRQISEGSFPRQLQLTRRCVAWRESEIENWMAGRSAS